ncbi:hypothetical protein D6774_01335 [Candidatus Woesearchaeota archaeon]|nr:MAG: hypothetical protein D6774_01335 [Candidatus Woesearchaeota archaeon]
MAGYGVHATKKKFIEYIEKKLRKTIREQGGLKKDETVVCSDFTYTVLKRILNLPFKRGDKGTVILDWFLEDEVDLFLQDISKTPHKEPQGIKLYLHLEYDTIKTYAQAIKETPPQKEFSNRIQRLEKLQALYPETKHALLKTIQKLKGN